MSVHLTPEELVLALYGDVRDHVCADCATRVEDLRRELEAVDTLPVPEPAASWEATAWRCLEPQLRRPTMVRPWLAFLATAAAVVVAFLSGREFPRQPAAPPVTVATAPEAGKRDGVLLLAVGDHLERSQLLLVEVLTVEPGETLPRERAGELVASSRLVRQAASGAGENGVADVLDELERVLVEIAQSSPQAGAGEVAALHRRIQGRSLLFKVRVLGTQVRQPALPTTSS